MIGCSVIVDAEQVTGQRITLGRVGMSNSISG
jgi:hypothetical protein